MTLLSVVTKINPGEPLDDSGRKVSTGVQSHCQVALLRMTHEKSVELLPAGFTVFHVHDQVVWPEIIRSALNVDIAFKKVCIAKIS